MKLALIDDHKLVHDGFKRLIETEKNWQVICQADSYQSAIDVLHKHQHELSTAIVDISLPDKNGIELAKYCLAQFPALKVIVVSMYDHNPYVANALDAGVKGYISKRAASDELLTGIEKVAAGDTYLSKDVINKLHFNDGNKQSQLSQLTERELEVFPLLAKGLNAKQVANELNIMPKTAHVHRANIHKKLAANNSFDLLKIALSSGVINLEELNA